MKRSHEVREIGAGAGKLMITVDGIFGCMELTDRLSRLSPQVPQGETDPGFRHQPGLIRSRIDEALSLDVLLEIYNNCELSEMVTL